MKPESRFARRVCYLLGSVGAMTFKVHGSPYQQAGWPDLFIQHREWSGWVELKAGDGKPTHLQLSVIGRLQEHGGRAFVLHERETHGLDGYGLLALLKRRGAERQASLPPPARPRTPAASNTSTLPPPSPPVAGHGSSPSARPSPA